LNEEDEEEEELDEEELVEVEDADEGVDEAVEVGGEEDETEVADSSKESSVKWHSIV
jgi:hypothetical protein